MRAEARFTGLIAHDFLGQGLADGSFADAEVSDSLWDS